MEICLCFHRFLFEILSLTFRELVRLSTAGRFQYKRPAAEGPVGGRSFMFPLLRLAAATLALVCNYCLLNGWIFSRFVFIRPLRFYYLV